MYSGNNGQADHMWAFMVNAKLLSQNSWISSKYENLTREYLRLYGTIKPHISSVVFIIKLTCLAFKP